MTTITEAPAPAPLPQPTPAVAEPDANPWPTRAWRIAPWTIVALAFGLNAWADDRSGNANAFYAVAVQSMAKNWHNFFFNAYDQGGFITIDKPPLAFWVQALSVKAFGYSTWSMLLPEAVAGAAAVGLMYLAVRRVWGRGAGLVASLALALTPTMVAVSRDNNPDALLVLTLVAAAWCMTRAMRSEHALRWALASAAFVGLGFNTKMLAAFIVVPGLWAGYLFGARAGWGKRALHLLAATGVLLAVSASWAVAVDLTPASSRPYIGGSTDNTVRDLVFGYNGFGRVDGQDQTNGPPGGRGGFRGGGQAPGGQAPTAITGIAGITNGPPAATGQFPPGGFGGGRPGGGGFGGANFGGSPGIDRLTTTAVGDQVAWLFPLAAIGGLAGLVAVALRRRLDARLGTLLLWGGWAGAAFVVFSFSKGIFHPYYVSLLAPAVAALAGIGLAVFCGAIGSPVVKRVLAGVGAVAIGATAVAEIVIARRIDYAAWTYGIVGMVALASAGMLATRALPERVRRGFGRDRLVRNVAGGSAAVALLVLPGLWSWNGTQQPTGGVFPVARPSAGSTQGFGFGGPGTGGVIGGPRGDQSGLLRYLEQRRGDATWIVAVASSNQAAPLTLESGQPVMAYGGFNGTDAAMTTDKLVDLVRTGKLRFILANGQQIGAQAGRNAPGQLDVSKVVTTACTEIPASTYGGTSTGTAGGGGFGGFGGRGNGTLYDCRGKADAIRKAAG